MVISCLECISVQNHLRIPAFHVCGVIITDELSHVFSVLSTSGVVYKVVLKEVFHGCSEGAALNQQKASGTQ